MLSRCLGRTQRPLSWLFFLKSFYEPRARPHQLLQSSYPLHSHSKTQRNTHAYTHIHTSHACTIHTCTHIFINTCIYTHSHIYPHTLAHWTCPHRSNSRLSREKATPILNPWRKCPGVGRWSVGRQTGRARQEGSPRVGPRERGFTSRAL